MCQKESRRVFGLSPGAYRWSDFVVGSPVPGGAVLVAMGWTFLRCISPSSREDVVILATTVDAQLSHL